VIKMCLKEIFKIGLILLLSLIFLILLLKWKWNRDLNLT